MNQEKNMNKGILPPAEAVVTREDVERAAQTLRKYRAGKRSLERRIVENEQWWKLRHWNHLRSGHGNPSDPKPASGWLVNVCLSKHADAMDAFPTCVCLPREPDDRRLADTMSDVLPVVLEQNDYEQVYGDCWWYKIKHGASCKGIFWDPERQGGLGDIAIRRIDLLNLFWEPGITDLQKSRNVFHVELCDDDLLTERWPQLRGKLGHGRSELTRYLCDDAVDTSRKSAVVDWYYRKNGALHFCKFAGGEVLFSSENAGMPYWYAHGRYPFVLDVLFPEEGTPAGYGYIDLCKDAQEQIDLMGNAILKNTLAAASPRWFIRSDGAINEEEYLDFTQPFVHTNATLGQDSILPVAVNPLSDIYVSCLDRKIEELKQVSGNRDAANGGTQSGVTAASAIAAMQEQAGKLSRDQIAASYRAFREECLLTIELMRQFYDAPRCFRVTGRDGERFVRFDNTALLPRPQGSVFGIELGDRVPLLDLKITAQRQSGYSKAAYNELALQLYRLGFFDPARSEQALQCLEIMDFEGREAVTRSIAQAGAAYRAARAAEAAERASAALGAPFKESWREAAEGIERAKAADGNAKALPETTRSGELQAKEHPFVARARRTAREASQPR